MAGLYTQGWLEKKSGGKEGHSKHKLSEKWTRRWFVLVGSEIRYFKSDEDYNKGKAALGAVECSGASLKLKEVQGNSFRFTVLSAARELKLRGPSSAYHMWNDALSKFVTEDDGNGSGAGGAESHGRSRAFTEGEAPRLAAGPGSFDGPITESGWLEKKSGGKEGAGVSSSFVKAKLLEKWSRRWFVLAGSELRYYRSDADYEKGKLPLGLVECSGAELSLKNVKGQTFRFTVLSASRELKLRASSPDEYQKWTRALTPLCGSTRQDLDESSRREDDDDERLGHTSEGDGEVPTASKREEQAGVSGGGGSGGGGSGGEADAAGGAAAGADGVGNPFAAMWGGMTSAAVAVNPFGESDEKEKDAASSNPFGEAVSGLIKRLSVSSMQEESKEELREKQKLEQHEKEDKDSGEDDEDWKPVEVVEDAEAEEGGQPFEVRATDPWSSAPSADAHSPADSERSSPTLPPVDELAKRRSLDLSFPEGEDLTPEVSPRRDGSQAAQKAGEKPALERARAGSFLSRILSPRTSKTPAAAVAPDEIGGGSGGNVRSSSSNPFGGEDGEAALGASSDSGNPFGGSALPPPPTAGSESGSNPFGDEGEYSPSAPPAQLPAVSAPLGFLGPLGSSASTPADYGGRLPGMTAAGTGAGVGMGGPAVSDAAATPFKLIIVGDSCVGKTCLLVRFVEGRYDGAAKPTISVDISSAALDLGSSTVALSLWDTAGQEKFAPLSSPYFRQADGVIIAFDVGARSSFDRVASYWMDEVFFKADSDV